jgi:tRNA/tmRNA/rRNA uracil-C5-methylase (TrmA/RlmC/RlmD family)
MPYNSPCCPAEGVREAPQRTGYRNKLEFTVGKALDGQSRVGFLLGRAQDGHFAVASSDTWPHVPPATEVLRGEFEELVQRSLHAVWDKLAFKGVWRLLMSRTTREGVSLVVVQIDPSSLDQSAQQTLEETLQHWAKEHNAKHKEQIGGLFLQHHSGQCLTRVKKHVVSRDRRLSS